MRFASKISKLLLIAALAVPTQSMGTLAAASHPAPAVLPPAESEAICHHHAGMTPPNSSSPDSPRPVSYQCCLTGHDAAVLQIVNFAQPSAQGSRVALPDDVAQRQSPFSDPDVLIVLSADPPGKTPLRI